MTNAPPMRRSLAHAPISVGLYRSSGLGNGFGRVIRPSHVRICSASGFRDHVCLHLVRRSGQSPAGIGVRSSWPEQ